MKKYDAVGIGNAIVDVLTQADDSFLELMGIEKGIMQLVERERPISDIVASGHDLATVRRIEHLLYIAEYKRRQSAPGVKITKKNFGRDRRYPITNAFRSGG